MSKKTDIVIEHDAEEFGVHVRQGGWRLGLLVARSVQKGKGQGLRNDRYEVQRNDFEKWSASAFAEKAGTSTPRVLRFLKTWDAAAEDGIVPESALLVPGEELEGMDALSADQWDALYPGGEPLPADKAEMYSAAAEAEDTTTGKVAQVAKNKKAMAAAIKADPAVALAAREALATRDAKSSKTPHGKQESPIDQFVNLHMQLRSAKRSLTEALGYVIDIRGVTDTDETRAAIAGYVQQIRHILDLIDEAAQGKSLDDELAELLADEDIR